MTLPGNFLRRHFEPLVLSTQVLVDLVVVVGSCLLAWWVREVATPVENASPLGAYREVFALTAAVCLVCFHTNRMYSPRKSLLNIEEFKAIAKSTIIAFLCVSALLVMLETTQQKPEGFPFNLLVPIQHLISLDVDIDELARLTLIMSFIFVFIMMMISRFISFKIIQGLHQRGIGNRNVLIYGAGPAGQRLLSKFKLVPTLGLNLIGFLDDDEDLPGQTVQGARVLGSFDELKFLAGQHKISEVFVANPDATDERIIEIVSELDQLGLRYHVVPRFYHLLSFKMHIETLDSIPLITREDRVVPFHSLFAKRVMDIVVSVLVLTLAAPLFIIPAILIKRESSGPVLFRQTRIGRGGKPFVMYKYRTMHDHLGGDEYSPESENDPRVTQIGRWLRRYSLDELPQFFNVLKGEMSVVGPRPEMEFIVRGYSALDRERLRVKPGVTGLWQVSYAREMSIHENLDYDLYYVENQTLLLDLVILPLTLIAVLKGTGAY